MVTKEEAMKCKTFHYGECTRAIGPNGGEKIDIVKWRASGKCKVWKRNPLKFSLPIKFGLYRSSYLTQENSDLFHTEENCPLRRKEIKENNTYIVKVPISAFLTYKVKAEDILEAREIVGRGDGELISPLTERDYTWDDDRHNWEISMISSEFTWNESLSSVWGKVPCTHCGRKTNVGDIVQIVFEEEEGFEDKIKQLFCRDHFE